MCLMRMCPKITFSKVKHLCEWFWFKTVFEAAGASRLIAARGGWWWTDTCFLWHSASSAEFFSLTSPGLLHQHWLSVQLPAIFFGALFKWDCQVCLGCPRWRWTTLLCNKIPAWCPCPPWTAWRTTSTNFIWNRYCLYWCSSFLYCQHGAQCYL